MKNTIHGIAKQGFILKSMSRPTVDIPLEAAPQANLLEHATIASTTRAGGSRVGFGGAQSAVPTTFFVLFGSMWLEYEKHPCTYRFR